MSEEMKKTINVEADEVEETKEGFVAKAKAGIKKHGKTIAAIAAIGTVGLIGYALGSKTKIVDSETAGDVIDSVLSEADEVAEL